MKEERVDEDCDKNNEVAHISVTVNQCMMVTIHFRSDELNSSAMTFGSVAPLACEQQPFN